MGAMFSRYLLKRLASVMTGLLLFAQLTVAAQACMLAQPVSMPASGDAMAMGDCAGAPMDKAACQISCLKADQPANPPVDHHFDVILPPVSAVAELSAPRRTHTSAIPSLVSRSSGNPSLQILFCSFQA